MAGAGDTGARAAGFRYVHALLNEGRPAGGSLAHSHSQLVWLTDIPPAVAARMPARSLRCWSRRGWPADRRRPRTTAPLVLPGARARPVRGARRAASARRSRRVREPAAGPRRSSSLADSIRRLHTVEERVPLNAWLHTGSHWHLELVPRLTIAAGLELGAGIYVNPLPPEEAALRLRAPSSELCGRLAVPARRRRRSRSPARDSTPARLRAGA